MPRVAWLEGIDAVAQWVGDRSSLGDDERLRLRFLIGGVGTGLATSALILVSMLVERALFGGIFIFLFDGLMVAGVLALRRGWSGFRQVAMWELLLLLGFFVVMSLQTRSSRVEQLYWFALMPMGAALLLGRGAAAAGLLVGLSGVGAVVLLRGLGLTFDEPLDTWLEEAVNVVAFSISVTVLSVMFETLRTRHAVEAERAAKARGLFLANVSHELRTPMNGVIGLTELLAGSQLDQEQRGHLDLLRRSGEAMVALINELLDTHQNRGRAVSPRARPRVGAGAGGRRRLLVRLAGAGQGGGDRRTRRSVGAALDPWRSTPAPAGAAEPGGQRRQVHRAR